MTKIPPDRAQQWRKLLLRAELGAWLHDLGKLSSAFIRSKSDRAYVTEDEEDGTKAGEWEHGDVLKQDGREGLFGDALPLPEGWEPVSIADLIEGHHLKSRNERLLKLLKRADGDDSGEDEYNAVGLNQREPVQAATVFGREEPLADDLEALDAVRRSLYDKLAPLLDAPVEKRDAIWALLLEALRRGLGKTQRAANDVRLGQHTWGVAARFKAFLLRDLLDPPPANERWPRRTFRLLTVQWNWWEAVTPFARLSDVVGRVVMLENLRRKLRRLVETEYGLGNRVYEDDDGVHFLIANLDWDEAELERVLRESVGQESGGEVSLVVALGKPTRYVTDLAAQMKTARATLPTVGEPAWVATWSDTPSGVVCPVCRRRPLEGDRELCPHCGEVRQRGIKRRLAQKRTVWSGEIADGHGRVALLVARFDLGEWLDGTMLHSLFITSPQDIARGQGVEEGDLATWDWAYLRHLFPRLDEGRAEVEQLEQTEKAIKEKKGKQRQLLKERDRVQGHRQSIASNDRIPQERKAMLLQREDDRLTEIDRDLKAIANDLADLESVLARPLSPVGKLVNHLRSKGGQEERIQALTSDLATRYNLPPADAFLLALARKNPSASRLLRVWQTTEEFLRAQADRLQEMVGERQRAVLTLRGRPRPGLYTADVPGLGQTDIFVRPEDGRAQTVTRLTAGQIERLRGAVGQPVRLLSREDGRSVRGDYPIAAVSTETYSPYQVITASPNLLLAMLPAEAAIEAAERLREAYAVEFGKVTGRLPFHVGLVFMDAHYPMFAALDTARRLVETFDGPGRTWAEARVEHVAEDDGAYTLTLHSDRFGRWKWHIPARRGDGKDDWYHPYLLIREGEGLETRGMSLAGPDGRWVHVSQVQEGDQVAFRPNLFDFLFLDTVSRRLEAHADSDTGRRPHPLFGTQHSPRPYLLERIADLQDVWEKICTVPGMSETRLNGVTTLLARKYRAWGDGHPEGGSYEWLVEKTVARDLGGRADLRDAVREGLFFDVVELYRHILKQSIEHPKEKETR